MTSDQPDSHRTPRVAGSCISIGIACIGIVNVSGEQGVSALLALIIFAVSLIISSPLIATIVYRLYLQHEVRRINFDLVTLMLLTVLIALPFAASNALWEHFQLSSVENMKDNKMIVLLAMAGIGAFLLFPVFFITEALTSWYVMFFKTGKK